jgi:hypothetical protein
LSYPKRAYSLGALSFVTGDSLHRLKRQGFEADHLTQTSVEVKDTWSFNSTNPICFLECTETFTINFVIHAFLDQSLSPSAPSVIHQRFYFRPAVSLTSGSVFRLVMFPLCVGECMWGCFGNICTCVYCVLYCFYCVFVFFCLCVFLFVLSVLV